MIATESELSFEEPVYILRHQTRRGASEWGVDPQVRCSSELQALPLTVSFLLPSFPFFVPKKLPRKRSFLQRNRCL